MNKQRECIVWLDAHSDDPWYDVDDIVIDLIEVETLGFCVGETSKVLCIAQSLCDICATSTDADRDKLMCCARIFIPKNCIISREDIIVEKKKENKKKENNNE